MNISSGKKTRAVKLLITGSEGIGKSTLASQCPDPLFVDTEGGTDQLDVKRIEGISKWFDLLTVPSEIRKDTSVCKTFVVDTLDWAEQMCIKAICEKAGLPSIESFGYGKGYTMVSEEFNRFLTQLNMLISAGINVVLVAHAKMRKQELPNEEGQFDRWETKLSRQVAPLVKEWADAVLFCNYATHVVSSETGAKKGIGGERVIYTSHHPCWDAKNRFGLADKLPLAFDSIASIFSDENAYTRLYELMDKDSITIEQIAALTATTGKVADGTLIKDYPEDYVRQLVANWDRAKNKIKEITK